MSKEGYLQNKIRKLNEDLKDADERYKKAILKIESIDRKIKQHENLLIKLDDLSNFKIDITKMIMQVVREDLQNVFKSFVVKERKQIDSHMGNQVKISLKEEAAIVNGLIEEIAFLSARIIGLQSIVYYNGLIKDLDLYEKAVNKLLPEEIKKYQIIDKKRPIMKEKKTEEEIKDFLTNTDL